jgi:hypothetical protein
MESGFPSKMRIESAFECMMRMESGFESGFEGEVGIVQKRDVQGLQEFGCIVEQVNHCI